MFKVFLISFFVCVGFLLRAQTHQNFHKLLDSANKYSDIDWNLAYYYAKIAIDNKDSTTTYENIIQLNVIFDSHYQKLNMLDSSFSILKQSLNLAKLHNDTLLTAYTLINMANVYVRANNHAASISIFKKALSVLLHLKDTLQVANTYYNLSTPYSELGMHDSALYYTDKAFVNYKKIKDYSGMAVCYDVYATYADKNGNYKEAVQFYELEIEHFKMVNEIANLIIPYQNLAETYLKFKDYKNCFKYLEMAMKLAKGLNSKADIIDISLIYSDYYEATGDYKLANQYMKSYYQGKDSIVSNQLKIELSDQKSEFDRENTQAVIKIQALEAEKNIKSKQFIIWVFVLSSLFFIIIIVLSLNRYRAKQKSFLKLNEYKNQLIRQKEKIEVTQKEILDSINYAKRIQYAILASDSLLQNNLAEYFILFKPKDIVSGDFYWATEYNQRFYIAICDSTGHGVPGAFMSLLNIGFLNEAIKEQKLEAPHEILNHVRQRLTESISDDAQRDGMDAVLVCFNRKTHQVTYSAANNNPILIHHNKIIILPKDKMPVGKGEINQSFKTNEVPYEVGEMLYLYTDGYADQFGGPKGKKFKYKQLNELLNSNSHMPLSEQKEILDRIFSEWKQNLEQVDDVLIAGIKL